MIKGVVAATVVAVSLCAIEANATCAPSDIIGTWDVYTQRPGDLNGYYYGVKIDSAGKMTGSIQWLDNASPAFTLSSTSPIKVDAACHISGNFAVTYGATENLTYAFRGTMTRNKDLIEATPFAWPNFNHSTTMRLIRK